MNDLLGKPMTSKCVKCKDKITYTYKGRLRRICKKCQKENAKRLADSYKLPRFRFECDECGQEYEARNSAQRYCKRCQ